MAKRVVIIGGSFAAIQAAKVLAKLPHDLEVIVISSSSHSYFNVGVPRVLVEPDKVEKLFTPTAKLVKSVAPNATFIISTVSSIDFEHNLIVHGAGDRTESLHYDFVVIATGAATPSRAFKLAAKKEETIAALRGLAAKIESSPTIAIIGGGPTGVETAAEIKQAYRDKVVKLYTGHRLPLIAAGSRVGQKAQKKLLRLGVQVINNDKPHVVIATDEHHVLTLESGATDDVSLSITTTGVIPNTGFLDPSVLDKCGYVQVDSHFRLPGTNNAFAIGDVASNVIRTVADLKMNQIPVFKTAVDSVIGNSNRRMKSYTKRLDKLTMFIPVGPEGGAGVLNGIGVPNIAVRLFKARDYMIPKAEVSFA